MTEQKSMGRWMIVLAWISAFGLLIMVFSELLHRQVNPNASPESSQVGNRVEVRLKQNRAGHYVTSGFINGTKVTFLVDTGATDVAVPAHLASTLQMQAGKQALASTANGVVRINESRIDTLRIGDIVLNDVEANLNPGMQGDEILLGMSVLRQLEFTQRGDWLILRTL